MPELDANGPPSVQVRRRSPAARWAWFVAGWLCVVVGAVGVVLPGIPTTGPLLLALACFARSSERMHRWLLEHRHFGPPLRQWQAHRTIPLRAKVLAVTMMLASFAYVALASPLPTWAVVSVGVLISIGIVVVLRLSHAPPTPQDSLRSKAGDASAR